VLSHQSLAETDIPEYNPRVKALATQFQHPDDGVFFTAKRARVDEIPLTR
jgi:hypothetical protein